MLIYEYNPADGIPLVGLYLFATNNMKISNTLVERRYEEYLYKVHSAILLLFVLCLLIFSGLGYRVCVVFEGSMAPTLTPNSLYLSRTIEKDGPLQHGEIVAFTSDVQDKSLVKRIIGLPGDEVYANNSHLYVNGELYDSVLGTGSWGPVTVPDSHVYVLGDNRMNSCDSRNFGCIPIKNIVLKLLILREPPAYDKVTSQWLELYF